MNIFYKFFARIYQFSMKMMIPLLPYKDPIVINSVEDLKDIFLKEHKPFIVSGPRTLKLGINNLVTDILDEKGIEYSSYTSVCPNPTSDVIFEALDKFKKDKCNMIVAIGGGSAMDAAKAIGALYVQPNKTLNDLKGVMKVKKKIPLLIALPTTCGTGSEVTLTSVVTDSKTNHKYSINDFPLIPSYAVLDYRLIKSLPKSLVATTGFDALTHALEAYIGRSTTKKTRKDSLEAIKLIFENIVSASENKDDESLQNMLLASFKAGKAFTRSYVGYVHALAHTLGGKYDIPHGYANAVILPYVLKEYDKAIYSKIAKVVDYLGITTKNLSKKEKFTLFIEELDKIETRLNISKKIEGINEEDIEEMANFAIKEGNPLYPVPVMWDFKKMKEMYYKFKA